MFVLCFVPQSIVPRSNKCLCMFVRRFIAGAALALPSWLKPGPIFVKKHVRNKDESLAEGAELIKCNPLYAHVRLSSGHETTVFIRENAPELKIILHYLKAVVKLFL